MPKLHPANILAFLDQADRSRLSKGANEVNNLEHKWVGKVAKYIAEIETWVINSLGDHGFEIPDQFTIADLLTEHYFDSLAIGFREAEAHSPKSIKVKLAGDAPRAKMPRSLKELMVLWDEYRRRPKAPRREQVLAERVKRAYLEKLKKIYATYSEEFRAGKTFDQDEVKRKIRRASIATQSRAKTIVETETTSFYNRSRREVYDKSDDVTHYLFLALRDMRTTKWCKTRHGLVYKKGDPLLDLESPACHWNCRSELLPLTPLNPKHLALINNESIQRRNNSPEPLPPNWRR